jgi:hypothetical protein
MSRLRRNSSRQGHFESLCMHSQNDSTLQGQQKEVSRKGSARSLSKAIDMDKLIGDVKITPVKDSQYHQSIGVIRRELEQLRHYPQIQD